MLNELRRIVQELNANQDLALALQTAAVHIRESIDTETCSIFLLDDAQAEYVLVATDGLNKKLISKLRLKLGEGLVGLTGEREEPINVENASAHPRFRYCPGLGEESFHAFMGVPIVHQRQVLGVMVVQQKEARRFDEGEVAFLVTIAAQLAVVIAHAKVTNSFNRVITGGGSIANLKGATFSGIPGAPGVAIGQAVVMYPLADLDAVPDRKTDDVKGELQLFSSALKSARAQFKRLSRSIADSLPESEQELFEVYARMLQSSSLINQIRKEIRAGVWAQGAVKRVIKKHIAQFEAMEDNYLAERATDLKDLGERILFHLQADGSRAEPQYPARTILIGEEVTPSALAEMPAKRLVGIVSGKGSGSSHVAILARALGIPTVMGVGGIPIGQVEGSEIIIDGYYGEVYLDPLPSVRKEFKALLKQEQEFDARLENLRDLPAETLDSHSLALYVNTGLAADVDRSLTVGAEGVGLFRTEVPFMVRERFPSEEEQRIIYHQLLKSFAPRPVIMRTLDVGGDKDLPYFPVGEDNPFLGWRGIRITLDHPEIFLVQLRAMLRASEGLNNLHIMLPMISNVGEVEAALRLLSQAHAELLEEGLKIKMPGVGVMVEVPAAVYQIRALAKRVDFVSVGSNDLTQYILAVDRNNTHVASLYDALHPAVLRALFDVVKGAHKERRHVSVCGEIAGDPLAVLLLLAMGFDTLSVNATSLPRIKWVIRNFSMLKAQQLLEEVLAMDDPIEIRCHMELALEEAGLGGLIRAGK